MFSNQWPSNHYETLFDVWHAWLGQTEGQETRYPILDRWLKKNLRSLCAPRSMDKSARPVRSLSLTDQFAISSAMFSAMRFMQLACALEQSYRAQAPLNWQEWDLTWSPDDVKKIPPAAFWYWIALRTDADNLPPRVIRDASERKAWFKQIKADLPVIKEENSDAAGLLWFGLRPQWLELLHERGEISGWSSGNLQDFLRMQNQSPPLWLRVQANDSPVDLQTRLQRDGVNVELMENGFLCAKGGADLTLSSSFKNGQVEIQDLASQQISGSVKVEPGQKVWDACAGAGGKSLAIAARMNNKGVVVATDLHDYKLDELKRRAKRASFFNIRTFPWSGDAPLRLPKEVAQQQGFDWVLIDAPCSSSGTWRRNPDARWRFNAADTAELLQLQKNILHNASAAVRKGGHLVYATCSWQVSENEQQVKQFLQEHGEFSLLSQTMVGAPLENADTMYVAVLKRG